MNRTALIALSLLGAALVAGGVRAHTAPSAAEAEAFDWYDRASAVERGLSGAEPARAKALGRALDSGTLFPPAPAGLSTGQGSGDTVGPDGLPAGAPPLPTVLSAARVDGLVRVQLMGPVRDDGTPTVVSVAEGEVTPGGWRVAEATLGTLVLGWGEGESAVQRALDIGPARSLEAATADMKTATAPGAAPSAPPSGRRDRAAIEEKRRQALERDGRLPDGRPRPRR